MSADQGTGPCRAMRARSASAGPSTSAAERVTQTGEITDMGEEVREYADHNRRHRSKHKGDADRSGNPHLRTVVIGHGSHPHFACHVLVVVAVSYTALTL